MTADGAVVNLMLLEEIHTPVSNLYGAGKSAVEQLKRLEVITIGDLLKLWPRYWEDRANGTCGIN